MTESTRNVQAAGLDPASASPHHPLLHRCHFDVSRVSNARSAADLAAASRGRPEAFLARCAARGEW